MQHTIIEFKARCVNHDAIREKLRQKGARFVGTDHQTDTYFRVPHGRLKLREGTIENSLVFYSRPNISALKQSEVTISTVPPGSEIKAALLKALGVLAIVDKVREIYFVDKVKIHLDDVAGVGKFLEVEAIGASGESGQLQLQCEQYRAEFGVEQKDFVAESYSDLLVPCPHLRDE